MKTLSVPVDQLRESLVSCMDVAEDALLLRADQAVSSASQNRYFEVLGDLRNQRRALVDEFLQCWQNEQEIAERAEAETATAAVDPALRALGLLADVNAVAGAEPPLPLLPRFRDALGRALSSRPLRPEGRVALMKAIESRCPSPLDQEGAELPAAWLRAMRSDSFRRAEGADACMDALRSALPERVGQADQDCEARLRCFFNAWEGLCVASGLPAPAVTVLSQLCGGFAAAWLLRQDWFTVDGCGMELLGDLMEILPGTEREKPPYLPMVQRTIDTLAHHPEWLPGVWLEWRYERQRRASLQQEWLRSVHFDVDHAAAVRAAARQVRDVTEQRMLHGRFPRPVLSLIRDGWLEVLMLGFLHPDDTGRMGRREAIRLLDELLGSVRADLSKSERRKVMLRLPQLLRSLRAGLEQTGMNAPQVNALLHELRGVHGPLIFERGEASAIDWVVADSAWFAAAFPGLFAKESADAGWAEECREGSWVEFAGEGWAGLHRYRIVYVDGGRDLVALANELQVAFETLSQVELERMLRAGAAKTFVVADTALQEFARTLHE